MPLPPLLALWLQAPIPETTVTLSRTATVSPITVPAPPAQSWAPTSPCLHTHGLPFSQEEQHPARLGSTITQQRSWHILKLHVVGRREHPLVRSHALELALPIDKAGTTQGHKLNDFSPGPCGVLWELGRTSSLNSQGSQSVREPKSQGELREQSPQPQFLCWYKGDHVPASQGCWEKEGSDSREGLQPRTWHLTGGNTSVGISLRLGLRSGGGWVQLKLHYSCPRHNP